MFEGSTERGTIPSNDNFPATQNRKIFDSPAFELNILLEKIEIALESYFPIQSMQPSEKIRPIDRTYLAEIHRIKLQQKSKGLKSFSRLSIEDASIVQLAETNNNESSVRYLKPSTEPQHQILARKQARAEDFGGWGERENQFEEEEVLLPPQTPTREHGNDNIPLRTPKDLRSPADSDSQYIATPTILMPTNFIRACHFHDGENHIDEIEFDIMPMIVRITPLSILDFAHASQRFAELIHLTSKGMMLFFILLYFLL